MRWVCFIHAMYALEQSIDTPWQYNGDKTKILLCGDACKKVQADLGGRVDVAFGCGSVTK